MYLKLIAWTILLTCIFFSVIIIMKVRKDRFLKQQNYLFAYVTLAIIFLVFVGFAGYLFFYAYAH
jgi:hypothetical protein